MRKRMVHCAIKLQNCVFMRLGQVTQVNGQVGFVYSTAWVQIQCRMSFSLPCPLQEKDTLSPNQSAGKVNGNWECHGGLQNVWEHCPSSGNDQQNQGNCGAVESGAHSFPVRQQQKHKTQKRGWSVKERTHWLICATDKHSLINNIQKMRASYHEKIRQGPRL